MRAIVPARSLTSAVVILTLCCGLVCFARPASAEQTVITLNSVGSAPVDLNAPLSFMDAVKVALARSDALQITQISLESIKLSETDTWYRLFPKLALYTAYNIPILKPAATADQYKESVSISFGTGSYDPLMAYLSHDASKAAVKLAELLHVAAIEEMMGRIAIAFLTIDNSKDEIACYKELAAEMEALERFTAKKLEAGTIASLDYKLVVERLRLARLELKQAVRAQDLTRRELKRLIGLQPKDAVIFKTDNASEVLTHESDIERNLQPEALMKNNLQLRAQVLRVKLEGYNITLAKADHVPKFAFGLSTPDPMSNQSKNLPYYVTLTASVPLWSWGETLRSTERARFKQQDAKIKEKLLLLEIQHKADELKNSMEIAEDSVSILRTMEQIQFLEVQRKEIAFSAGSAPYDTLVSARQHALRKRLEAIKAKRALDEARVKLKIATGSLASEYLQVDYGKLEND